MEANLTEACNRHIRTKTWESMHSSHVGSLTYVHTLVDKHGMQSYMLGRHSWSADMQTCRLSGRVWLVDMSTQ